MKTICVFLFSLLSITAFSQGAYRKEAEVRQLPKDIVEYYLILPGKPYNASLYGQNDGLSEFEFRKQYLRPMPDLDIVIDKKNAFISIQDHTSELGYRLQLTYFTQPDGKRIIAVYEEQEGGDCDSRSFVFYRYSNKKFIPVTNEVLPKLTLRDFCPASSTSKFERFEAVYDLPNIGTTIKVTAKPLCEYHDLFRFVDSKDHLNAEEYYAYFNKLACNPVELTWNKVAGDFKIKK
jgi:hypothetical protein